MPPPLPPPLVLIALIVHLAPGVLLSLGVPFTLAPSVLLSLGAPFTLALDMPLIIMVLLALFQVALANSMPFTLLVFRLDLIRGDGTFCVGSVDGEALYNIHFLHLLALCEKALFIYYFVCTRTIL